VRWLDAAFVLRQPCVLHDSCWRNGEKERHSQSGVKPPHSQTAQTPLGGSTQNKNRITEIGLDFVDQVQADKPHTLDLVCHHPGQWESRPAASSFLRRSPGGAGDGLRLESRWTVPP
jgi:hypothetical protein